jgi:hypothetical protein
MTAYGAEYPTIAEQQERGEGYSPWSDLNNVLTSDNTRTASAVNVLFTTDYLIVRGFGFTIPDTETIAQVRIDVKCSGIQLLVGDNLLDQEVCDETVSLLIDGSISAVNLARPAEVWAVNASSETTRTFYTSEPLTYAQANSEDFGVVLAGHAVDPLDPGSTCKVDSIAVTLYTASGGIWRNSPMGSYSAINGMLGVK